VNKFIIGFTGTRGWPTDYQQKRVFELLIKFHEDGSTVFHHGDCEGSDQVAHALALRAGYTTIHMHPPTDPKFRAFCHKVEAPLHTYKMSPMKPYLGRNLDIIRDTNVMISTPMTEEVLRSGTWSTIRQARKAGRPIWIIYPDRVVVERDPYVAQEG
jgi:hypothetical protein